MTDTANQSNIYARRLAPPSHRRFAIPQEYVIFAIFVFIFVQTSSVIPLLMGSGGPVNVTKQALILPLILIVVWYRRHLLRGALGAPELAAFLGLVVLSYLWSVAPDRYISSIIAQVILGTTAMTLGSMMSMRGLLFGFGVLLLGSAFGSLAAVAVFPSARSSGDGTWAQTWRGVFNHKNGLGVGMSLATIMACTLWPIAAPKYRKYLIAGGLLALALLIHSESRASQSLTLIILSGIVLSVLVRKDLALWAIIFLLSVASLLVGAAFVLSTDIAQPIFDMIGRKPTLSSRIPIWVVSMDAVAERPWFGYGFFSFWDPESKRVLAIARDPTVGFVPYYSHNGLVEILLSVGIVGLTLMLLAILRCFVAYFRILSATGEGWLCLPYLLLVVTFILSNVLEATVLNKNALIWTMFIAIATRLCLTDRVIRQEKRRTRTGSRREPDSGPEESSGKE